MPIHCKADSLLQLKQFSLQLLHRKIRFTANEYFALDNTFFHSVSLECDIEFNATQRNSNLNQEAILIARWSVQWWRIWWYLCNLEWGDHARRDRTIILPQDKTYQGQARIKDNGDANISNRDSQSLPILGSNFDNESCCSSVISDNVHTVSCTWSHMYVHKRCDLQRTWGRRNVNIQSTQKLHTIIDWFIDCTPYSTRLELLGTRHYGVHNDRMEF